MGTLRIKGANGRGFRHAGLELDGKTWLPVEMTPELRATVRDFHGRYITIHPDDRKRLEADFGLKLAEPGKPLVDSKKSNASKPASSTPAKEK